MQIKQALEKYTKTYNAEQEEWDKIAEESKQQLNNAVGPAREEYNLDGALAFAQCSGA